MLRSFSLMGDSSKMRVEKFVGFVGLLITCSCANGGELTTIGSGDAGLGFGANGFGGSAAGGAASGGGTTSSGGGTTGSGGFTSSGGDTGSGDSSSSSGGTTASGGTTSSGGATASGGATSSGGTTASGGTTSSGGTTASGGATSSGGSSGDGGIACPVGQKDCSGTCTSPTPNVGCGLTDCTKCPNAAPANGFLKCTNGACDFDCFSGYTKSGSACTSTTGGTGGTGGNGKCSASSCPSCGIPSFAACCTGSNSCGCEEIFFPVCG
jgi:hypothetical protein